MYFVIMFENFCNRIQVTKNSSCKKYLVFQAFVGENSLNQDLNKIKG